MSVDALSLVLTIGIGIIGLIGSFAGGVFWFGGKFARLESTVERMAESISEIKDDLKRMPTFEQRLVVAEQQLMHLVTDCARRHRE